MAKKLLRRFRVAVTNNVHLRHRAPQQLRKQYPRLDTMDLKIAAIVLTHDATLLTRNQKDFR